MSKELCPVARAAKSFPGAPALFDSAGRVEYREFDRLVEQASGVLFEVGIRPGDRVALLAAPGVKTVSFIFALFRLGAVVCPLNLRYPPSLLENVIRAFGIKYLLVGQEQAELGGRVFPRPLVIERAWSVSGKPVHETVDLESEATILATSGSTGLPKGVVHALRSHILSAIGAARNMPLAPGDRYLLSLPLYHAGGLAILFRTILSGAACVVAPSKAGLPEVIENFGITHLSLVATQLKRLVEQGAGCRERLRTLKAVLVGGGPVPSALLERALELGFPIHTTYGLTETASQVTTTPAGTDLDDLKTAGRVLPYRRVHCAEDGEIMVGGAVLFRGYATAGGISASPLQEGWFRTGDLGVLDDRGRLKVLGRKDRMFISGGENIHPEFIENALLSVEGVREAAVVPVTDAQFGRKPVAFVRTLSGQVDSEKLRSELEALLPRFMIPRSFFSFPPGGLGLKPSLSLLQRLAEERLSESA